MLANDFRKLLGAQASDYEGKLMASISDPVIWLSEPELALSQFNTLRDSSLAAIKGIVETPSERQESLKARVSSESPAVETYSSMAMPGVEILKIPKSFKNKEEAKKWYSNLSPQLKRQVLAQQGQ